MTVVDKYGINKIYKTKTNGLEWFNKWDNGKSRTLKEGDKDPYDSRLMYTCGSPNVPIFIRGDKTRVEVTALTSSVRLFVTGPWTNTEMTVYVKTPTDGSIADISLRSRSNHETKCGFGNYEVKYDHPQKEVACEVEPLHPHYKRHLDEHSFEGFKRDRYVGFKQITRTIQSQNKVKVEGWYDSTEMQNQWKKLTEYTFDGKNSNLVMTTQSPEMKECGGLTEATLNQRTLWLNKGTWCWIRLNGANQNRIKNYSIREIDPIV